MDFINNMSNPKKITILLLLVIVFWYFFIKYKNIFSKFKNRTTDTTATIGTDNIVSVETIYNQEKYPGVDKMSASIPPQQIIRSNISSDQSCNSSLNTILSNIQNNEVSNIEILSTSDVEKEIYFKPYGSMGDNASSLNGIMSDVGKYYPMSNITDVNINDYNRIFCNECGNMKMTDDTDDIRRNYTALIEKIRNSRDNEYPSYLL